MTVTLEQVKTAIDDGNSTSEQIRDEVGKVGLYLKRYFDKLSRDRLDNLEAQRERRDRSSTSVSGLSERIKEKADGFRVPPLLAPLLAIPAAAEGLRAIRGLGPRLGKAINSIGNALKRLGNSLGRLARSLGRSLRNITRPLQRAIRRLVRTPVRLLNDALKRVGQGIKGLGITKALNNAATSLRNRLYRMVGLTPDGKLRGMRDAKTGRFTKNNIGRVFQQIGKTVDAIADWARGTGKAVTSVFRAVSNLGGGAAAATAKYLGGAASGAVKLVGSGVGGALKVIGKVMWPISILFALYDGIKGYQEAEGDQADKIAGGVAGFLGDLIGAPLNLLKDVVSWTLNEMGFEKASEFLDGLDIEQALKDSINKLWGWFRKGLQWIGDLFTDPVAALTELWNGLLAGAASLGEWLWNNGIKPLGEWILSFIPNPVPYLVEKWNEILGGVASFGDFVYDKAIRPMGEWLSSLFNFEWPTVDFSAAINDLADYITGFVSNIISYMKEKFRNWWNGDGKEMEPPSGQPGTPEAAAGYIEQRSTPSLTSEEAYAGYMGGGVGDIYDALSQTVPSAPPGATPPRPAATLERGNPKVSAQLISDTQAYLDSINGQSAGVTSVVTDGSQRVDNSVRQTNVYQQGANNIDPNALAVPGFGPR